MSLVATKWRQFKTNLIGHYILDKYKDKSPCGKYCVNEETWCQFVQIPHARFVNISLYMLLNLIMKFIICV